MKTKKEKRIVRVSETKKFLLFYGENYGGIRSKNHKVSCRLNNVTKHHNTVGINTVTTTRVNMIIDKLITIVLSEAMIKST